MKDKKKLKAIELFAGAGGMALGLQQAGVDVVGLVEKDKWCLETLRANRDHAFPNSKIIEADINMVNGEWLLRQVGIPFGQLDVLSGGPPCQGFSFANMGKRSIDDPRSKMMWQYLRLLGEIEPRYFVIENVRGLLSFNDFFFTLLEELENKGYIVRFNLLDAAGYGVPQRRLRVFIDGARKDLNIIPAFPAPTHFDLDKDKSFPPASFVAAKCFAVNGFTKEQIKYVWWNTKLGILMDKRTAAEKVDQAVREIILEGLLEQCKQSKTIYKKTPLFWIQNKMRGQKEHL